VNTKQIVIFFILLGLACLSGPLSIPIPGTEVDISLQTLFLVLPAFVFPLKIALLLVVSYLLVGALGLPVFSDGSSGIDVLLGPHIGFFIGFLMSNIAASVLKNRLGKRFWSTFINFSISQFVTLITGFIVLSIKQDSFHLMLESLNFIPGLLVKSLIGSGVVGWLKVKNLIWHEH
jgi:biotin transport system substrate-specific component